MMKIGDLGHFGLFVGCCVGAAVPCVKRGYPKDLKHLVCFSDDASTGRLCREAYFGF